MEANKILSADILDIVFDGRNKDYGAYDLRKTYNKRIFIALVITASIALLALLGSVLASQLKKSSDDKVDIKELTLQDIKQEEQKVIEPPPPPPPKPPEPPKIETAKFTPPKIVEDEKVQEPPPAQEKLDNTKIAETSQEGIKEEEITSPPPVDDGKGVVQKKEEDDENKVFTKVEKEASFKGGDAAWAKYLRNNLDGNVPVDEGATAGQYTVVVQFIVDKEGNISNVEALSKHGFGMEREAMRVIKSGPKWEPAVQNGRQVKAYRKQPITFVVQDGE